MIIGRNWLTPEPNLLSAQVQLVLRNTNLAIISGCIAYWLLALIAFNHNKSIVPFIFISIYSLIVIYIIFRARHLLEKKNQLKHVKSNALEIIMYMTLLGIVSSNYIIWAFQNSSNDIFLAHILLIFCITAGSMSFSAAYLPIFLACTTPNTCTFVYILIGNFYNISNAKILAEFMPLYILSTLYFSREFQTSSKNLLQTRIKSDQLAQTLAKQSEQKNHQTNCRVFRTKSSKVHGNYVS